MNRELFEKMIDKDHEEGLKMNAEPDKHQSEVNKIKGIAKKPETDPVEKKEKFKIWQTIETGVGPKTGKELRNALRLSGIHIPYKIESFLEEIAVSDKKDQIELVETTALKLGLSGGRIPRQDVVQRAKEEGLEPCPPEYFLRAMLQNPNMLPKKGERVLASMEPFNSGDFPGDDRGADYTVAAWRDYKNGKLELTFNEAFNKFYPTASHQDHDRYIWVRNKQKAEHKPSN